MSDAKRKYKSPKLVVHGDAKTITLHGGGGFADQPIGIGDAIGTGNTTTASGL